MPAVSSSIDFAALREGATEIRLACIGGWEICAPWSTATIHSVVLARTNIWQGLPSLTGTRGAHFIKLTPQDAISAERELAGLRAR